MEEKDDEKTSETPLPGEDQPSPHVEFTSKFKEEFPNIEAFYENRLMQSTVFPQTVALLVVSYLSQGKPVRQFGGFGDLNYPKGLTISENFLIVADSENHRVILYNKEGKVIQTLGGNRKRSSKPGLFSCPYDVTLHGTELFISDSLNDRIQIFDLTQGTFLRKIDPDRKNGGPLRCPRGLAIAGEELFVAEEMGQRISVFNHLTGTFVRRFGGKGCGEGQLFQPQGLHVLSDRLLVADRGNHRIQIFDCKGVMINTFGTFGQGYGQLWHPTSITSREGEFYLSDYGNHRVCVFEFECSNGGKFESNHHDGGKFDFKNGGKFKFSRLWGMQGSRDGEFHGPYGICAAQEGIFVTDCFNHRIQVFI